MTTPTKETHSWHGMFRPPFDDVLDRVSSDLENSNCQCGKYLLAAPERLDLPDRAKIITCWLAGHFDEPVYKELPSGPKCNCGGERRGVPCSEFCARSLWHEAETRKAMREFKESGEFEEMMREGIRGSLEPPAVRIGVIEVGGTAILGGPEMAEAIKADRLPFLDSQKKEIGYADNFRVECDKTLCDLHIDDKTFPAWTGSVRFSSDTKEALEIEFPTINSADLVGEMTSGASELFGDQKQESVFSSNPERIAPGHDIRDHAGEIFGRVAGFSTDSSGRTSIVASRVRPIDACPVCFHRFEKGKPPHFKAEDGGQGHDGERAIHWQSGTQTCPNCAATWQSSDSD